MVFARRRRVRPVAIDPSTGQVISPLPFIGLVLLVSAAFLYGVAFWLVPLWAALLLLAAWLTMFVLCFVWWTPYPRRVVGLGAGAFALWFAVIVAGGILNGWGV